MEEYALPSCHRHSIITSHERRTDEELILLLLLLLLLTPCGGMSE